MIRRTGLVLCCTMILFTSCVRENGSVQPFSGKDVTFKAEIEDTKVSLSADGYALNWNESDEISVLDGRSNVLYEAKQSGHSATFVSEQGIADGTKELWSVYPYSEENVSTGSSVVVEIPALQNIAGGGSDPKANVCFAYTDKICQETQLSFLNACSYLSLSLPESDKITEVDIKGEDGDIISGKVRLSLSKKGEVVYSVVEGKKKIVLKSSTPIKGNCMVALLPCVMQNGFSVTLRSEDGRVASHRVISKDSESGIETAVTFLRGKINRKSLSISDPAWKNPPVVQAARVSATAASICWSENGFINPEEDFAGKYVVGLYSDESCSTPVFEFDWHAEPIANMKYPAFCFTGIDENSTYWAKVVDARTDASSSTLKISTSEASFKEVSAETVNEGDIALLEDFSCVSLGGDPVAVACGLVDGQLSAKPDALVKWTDADLQDTRLATWKETGFGHNYVGPGYVRVGDSAGQKDAVQTPVLVNLRESATVTVDFKAAPYSSDYGAGGKSKLGECYAEVWVVNGDTRISAGIVELNDDPTGWTDCRIKAYNVLPSSRIAIGGAYGEKTQISSGKQYARIYVDDVKLTVNKYEHVDVAVAPEAEVVHTFWSDSFIQWTCGGTPEGYTVSVDGEPYASLSSTATECHIKGLAPGKTYSVVVTANYKYDSADSKPISISTGTISQLTRNLSPTSVSVAIENRAGDNTTNNNPCIYIELLDGPDPENAEVIRSAYVLDAQIQSPASPFFGGLIVDNKKSRAPMNVALGSLTPSTDYWFRVKSVARYDFTSYQPSTPASSYCESSNGDSDFSLPVKVSTPASHVSQGNEILYLGFDELMLQADYVNCAVGSVPAFKAAGKKVGDMTLATVREWTGGWSFYGQRTAFASTQLAPQYAWGTQQTASDDVFTLVSQLVTGTSPGVGAKIYKFKDWTGSLAGWISSNNTYPCQGYIQLGYYYDVSDAKKQNVGMLASPVLNDGRLDDTPSNCRLSFNALVLQGRPCALGIWIYDGSSKSWSKVSTVDLFNSAGITTAAESWSALSETHKWYRHEIDIRLKKGDRIAVDTDKNGAALIDEIQIVKL